MPMNVFPWMNRMSMTLTSRDLLRENTQSTQIMNKSEKGNRTYLACLLIISCLLLKYE